jgi:release factor glutamine methyltransferase
VAQSARPSYAELTAAAVRHLTGAGLDLDSARIDAEVIARALLHWDRARWVADRREPADAGFLDRFAAAITRRARREPVAYIVGEREFYGRPFLVTPAVLIPRPETELVVDEALAHLDARPPRVADVGTGSGCLAVTIAAERPDAALVATDISADALAVARQNALRHGVSGRIRFEQRALVAPVAGGFDLIVSNPPYIGTRDRESLPDDVRAFEPDLALFAGDTGLDVIGALVPRSSETLRPGGILVMEIGRGQDAAAARLVAEAGLELRHIRPDLAGIPRVVVAVRPRTSL